MNTVNFIASCPFEIGDRVRLTDGSIHTITDISCTHYAHTGWIEFRYELDNSGKYIRAKANKRSLKF